MKFNIFFYDKLTSRVERQVNFQSAMQDVPSTNGSFTITDEARSTVKVFEISKFWLKSSVLAGIVTK